MGCCVSTNSEARPSDSKKLVGSVEVSSKRKGFSHESRDPPSSVEEETVKEVLSETPKPKPVVPVFTAEMKPDLQEEETKETKIGAHKVEAFAQIHENQNLGGNEEIMSEASEICSVSISESLSTVTNVTDNNKRENEEEVEQEVRQRRQRRISRSPAKPAAPSRNAFKRDQPMNQSPSRRSDQSPARRTSNGSLKLVHNQEPGRVKGPGRRDQGESSGRRSRSPATTRSSAAMSRSSPALRTQQSPGRVRSEQIEYSNGTGITSSRKLEAKRAATTSLRCLRIRLNGHQGDLQGSAAQLEKVLTWRRQIRRQNTSRAFVHHTSRVWHMPKLAAYPSN